MKNNSTNNTDVLAVTSSFIICLRSYFYLKLLRKEKKQKKLQMWWWSLAFNSSKKKNITRQNIYILKQLNNDLQERDTRVLGFNFTYLYLSSLVKFEKLDSSFSCEFFLNTDVKFWFVKGSYPENKDAIIIFVFSLNFHFFEWNRSSLLDANIFVINRKSKDYLGTKTYWWGIY